MTKVRFIKSLWRAGTILGQSSQDPKHPALDTQIDTKDMYWKSGAMEKLVDGGLNLWESATDLTNWEESISGTSTINREATEKIEGAYSCRIDVDASNSSVNINQTRTLVPNKKHKIIIWYKNSTSGKTFKLTIRDAGSNKFLQSDGTWAGSGSITLPNSTVWIKYELGFYAHADYSSYAVILMRLSAASSSIYFDKVSLVECPSIDLDVGEFEPAGKGMMNFDAGKTEPKVGEWLYGQGAQGKVVSVTVATGSWQGDDATGSIVLEKYEGCFNDDEDINGSVGGSTMLKVNHPDGSVGVDKLVKNGSFVHDNDPPNDWANYFVNETLTTEAGGQVGNCMMITATAGGNAGCQQNVFVTAGKIYKLSFYVKQGTEATFAYRLYDIDKSVYIYWGYESEAGAGWTQYTHTFEAPVGCANVRIVIFQNAGGAGTTIYFDEVSLYELDEEDTEKEIDTFALLDHNLSPTAQIKLIGAMDTAFTKALKTITIPYHEGDIRTFLPELGDDILNDGGLNLWDDATHLTHWIESTSGSSTVNRESGTKIEGAYSCRLDVDASNNSVNVSQINVFLTSLKKHKIVIWYKNSVAGKTARFSLRNATSNVWLKEDGTWNIGTYNISLPNSTVWKKYELDFYAHEDYSSYRIYLANDSAASSSIYYDDVSIQPFPPDNRIAYPVLRRYWKPEITDPDNPDGYIKGAYISIGKYFEPSRSFVKPHEKGDDDLSEGEYSDGGVFFGQEKEILETWLLPFKGLTTVSKDAIDAFIKYHKKIHAFIVVFDSDNPNSDSHLVKLENIASRPYQHMDYWNWRASLIEVK